MKLTDIRRSKDMSLGELACSANLGTQVMSRIERGLEIPPDSVCADIGAALGMSAEEVRASLPAKEESDAELDRFSDGLKAMAAAHANAKANGLGKGHGGQGAMECPICKGRLLYSVASVNGHIWGKCQTSGCVSWMQ